MTEREAWAIRFGYLKANVWELFVAFLAIFACVSYFMEPASLDHTSVGQTTYPEAVWNGMYGVGALFVVFGLFFRQGRLELAGLCLFGSAVGVQAISMWHIYGGNAASSLAVLIAFAGASAVRIYDLLRAP